MYVVLILGESVLHIHYLLLTFSLSPVASKVVFHIYLSFFVASKPTMLVVVSLQLLTPISLLRPEGPREGGFHAAY